MKQQGSDENKPFHAVVISESLNKSAYACASFASVVRKASAKGEVVTTANLDDSELKIQVSQQSVVVEGLNLGEAIDAKYLPAAKVEEEVEA